MIRGMIRIVPQCPECGGYTLIKVPHDYYSANYSLIQCAFCGKIIKEIRETRISRSNGDEN